MRQLLYLMIWYVSIIWTKCIPEKLHACLAAAGMSTHVVTQLLAFMKGYHHTQHRRLYIEHVRRHAILLLQLTR